ncbi:hypothetical protein NDU88_004599 [Pleurodeles waltl]|uniref:Uncharacterized protein n=1 Tax=Pleurodeles waltl TaxID=8319 RepID=A0AAV7LV37_PLEWA|nr:hypothetical protein NDU88_004599 [Pleurodeles waltl]
MLPWEHLNNEKEEVRKCIRERGRRKYLPWPRAYFVCSLKGPYDLPLCRAPEDGVPGFEEVTLRQEHQEKEEAKEHGRSAKPTSQKKNLLAGAQNAACHHAT